MSAAPSESLPPLEPALPPTVPMQEHAFELLAAHLEAFGAVACAALVSVGSVRLVQLWRARIADDLWSRVAKESLRMRVAELTLRTLHLVAAGQYAAAVDALEAHAVTGCEDCWDAALDARAYVLCAGCSQRLEVDALPVVDDEILLLTEGLPDAPDDVAPTEPPPELEVGEDVPCHACHGTGTSPYGMPCGLCARRPGLRRCDAAMSGELAVDVRWS